MALYEAYPGDLPGLLTQAVANDTIFVNGAHPPLSLWNYNKGGRVSIIGRPGATIGKTTISQSSNLLFKNVGFRGEVATPMALTSLVSVDSTSTSVGFISCTFATVDDTSAWTPQDWRDRPHDSLLALRGSTQSVTNSRFFNARGCIWVTGTSISVKNNVFEAFSVDGIRFGGGGNYQTYEGNTIKDCRHTSVEPLHSDAMQGYPGPTGTISQNITIQDNVVETSPLADYLQGISAFDGKWKNIKVVRNTISVCQAYHGITFFGVDTILIDGNTVTQERPGNIVPWIQVTKAKDGTPSTNVTVTNNIAPLIKLD